jgi:hypothetical protein
MRNQLAMLASNQIRLSVFANDPAWNKPRHLEMFVLLVEERVPP